MQTTVIVLGSGQDGGSPQAGNLTGVGPQRDGSSVAVISRHGRVMLLDASPDFRRQTHRLLKHPAYPPGRSRCLDAVGVTHAHMGHYAGLLHLGPEAMNEQDVDLVATDAFHGFMMRNDPWAALIEDGHLAPVSISSDYRLDESVTLRGIPVPHRAEYTDTVAFSVMVDGAPWLLYLPDIDGWEAWAEAEATIQEHAVALLDATFSAPSELPGRNLDDIPHPFVEDTISRFRHLAPRTRIVLTHLNHSNAVAEPSSPIAASAVAVGFDVAYDGLTVTTV